MPRSKKDNVSASTLRWRKYMEKQKTLDENFVKNNIKITKITNLHIDDFNETS